jgi:hypothetical protein
VLWQVGVAESITELTRALCASYPDEHEAIVYEASPFPGLAPRTDSVPLARLDEVELTPRSTLYVPPAPSR